MKNILVFILCFNIIIAPVYALIQDDFADMTLDKNLKIKKYQFNPIEDEFAQKNKNKNPNKKLVVIDEVIPKAQNKKIVRKPVIIDENYKEVRIKIKQPYSTKLKLDEGDKLEFTTLNDVEIKNKIYPKNSTVQARLETISKNKSFGVPSDVLIGNFVLDNNILSGEIKKQGANRTLWLYPVVTVTSCFFGLGLLLIPIRGGHAKIKPSETFVIYSY